MAKKPYVTPSFRTDADNLPGYPEAQRRMNTYWGMGGHRAAFRSLDVIPTESAEAYLETPLRAVANRAMSGKNFEGLMEDFTSVALVFAITCVEADRKQRES